MGNAPVAAVGAGWPAPPEPPTQVNLQQRQPKQRGQAEQKRQEESQPGQPLRDNSPERRRGQVQARQVGIVTFYLLNDCNCSAMAINRASTR